MWAGDRKLLRKVVSKFLKECQIRLCKGPRALVAL